LFEDFDNEMRRRGLDTAMVIGESTLGNPELAYVTGTTIPRGEIFPKRIGHRQNNVSLIESLRETKDPAEIDKIRNVGVRATHVVESILEMLRACTVTSGKLRLERKVLTVGMVKSRINALLAEQDLIAPEGTVFGVGPSSWDPHEMGIP
jgi:Xaa-Pro aminopeptidase